MIYKVGLRTLPYTDAARANWSGTGPRPLLTDIWYPAPEEALEEPQLIGPPGAALFTAGPAARDAELAPAPAMFPLILLSHGTGGAALQHGWLASALAARGYIVAGANHHGNTALEPYAAQGFARVWERPRDLSVVLDQLLEDPTFGPRIDRRRIGAAGFSLGGYTAIALAGGVLNLRAFLEAQQAAGRTLADALPPEFPDPPALVALFETLAREDVRHKQSYRDERVRAVFAIAPALGEGFTPAGLAPVAIPVKIVAGAADTNTPPDQNARRYAGMIADAELVILEGHVGHYTFLAEATEQGRRILPAFSIDHPSIDRAAIHREVGRMAVEFFDMHLVPM